jgi:hypothetical protein
MTASPDNISPRHPRGPVLDESRVLRKSPDLLWDIFLSFSRKCAFALRKRAS